MAKDLTPVVVCKTLVDAESYQQLLEEAGFECEIVETKEYSDSTSYEVSVAEKDYDKAFKIVEIFEEG